MAKPWAPTKTIYPPKMRIGPHKVKIIGFQYKKNGDAIVHIPGTNNPAAITVSFQNEEGIIRRKNFSLKDKALWVLESFSEAIGVDLLGGGEYDVDIDIIGKELYIIVVKILVTKGGVVIIENGKEMSYTDIKARFYSVDQDFEIIGIADPVNPTGDFVEHREQWLNK